MASSTSGQYVANSVFWLATQAGKMEWHYTPGIAHFVPATKILPKFKRVHESFLSQNIFSDSKKIFCDLFVGMELENEKTETRYHFCIQLASFSVLENKQVRRSFFQCSLCHILNLLLTKLVRSRWLDIGLVLFFRVYGPRLRLGP